MASKGQGRGLAAPIYVRLTPALHDALARLAASRGLTMAELTRLMLAQAVASAPGPLTARERLSPVRSSPLSWKLR